MKTICFVLSIALAALPAGCGTIERGEEDCALAGDEDGNDLADCGDPACAGEAACQLGCGNGRVEAGEICDDGNLTDDDGCDTNCKPTTCGNGLVTAGESCDDGNLTSGDGCDANCTVTACGNGIPTTGEACDDGNATDWDGCGTTCNLSAPPAYLKASNTGPLDAFGYSVALSADGSTLAVGAYLEDGSATGINQNDDDTATNAGAVYVFAWSGSQWSQQAYIKASNTGATDRFGYSVALSADGSTLAVGAYAEDSAATEGDNTATDAGAVYVFTRSGATWTQQAYIKASNTGAGDQFGISVALSADGSTLAVGAYLEDSSATGIDGNELDNAATDAGAVYLFARSGATWTQQAYVKASNTDPGDRFGYSVALSADGLALAVGAFGERSAATGIGGNQASDAAADAGAVYVFTHSGTAWTQEAYVKASNTGPGDRFGWQIALSADGSTLAVGAQLEDSAATGVEGSQTSNAASDAGAAYVFSRSGTAWTQQAYLKASNTGADDQFGTSIALSADGSTLAVGAVHEASMAVGVGGDQVDNSVGYSGAVYVFARSGTAWTQQVYVKASNTGEFDYFGDGLALSGNGSALAVGAIHEDGISGDPSSSSATDSGAVYVYR